MRSFIILAFCLVLGMCWATGACAAEKKIRIGYLEAGPYWAFERTFDSFKAKLVEKGWGDRLEYPKDAHLSPGWGPENESLLQESAKKLMARKDLDAVVGMGTAATNALLKANNHRTIILGQAVSDALVSKMILSPQDSGVDNFTVRYVPDRWKIMFELFHDIVGFKKLGILYPDTEEGMIYSNVKEAREASKERGFELLEYKEVSRGETTEDCWAGIKDLHARGMDALFISALNCFDWDQSEVRPVYDYLHAAKIATFARDGSQQVKAGALLGLSTLDYAPIGDFLSDQLIQVMQGVSPRKVPMVDKGHPKIALNIETAQKIGFDFPMNILLASDEIYEQTIDPKKK